MPCTGFAYDVGDRTQDFTHVRQVLLPLSCIPMHLNFCFRKYVVSYVIKFGRLYQFQFTGQLGNLVISHSVGIVRSLLFFKC